MLLSMGQEIKGQTPAACVGKSELLVSNPMYAGMQCTSSTYIQGDGMEDEFPICFPTIDLVLCLPCCTPFWLSASSVVSLLCQMLFK